ncbi:MAG: carbonic anhydrase [Balneolia bacterium]|nr:carbonic anhydrase [Balneolia bacterium]
MPRPTTPQEVLQAFKEGNQRFVDGNLQRREFVKEIQETCNEQHPFAIVLSCIDSRVPVETVFDMRIGELFSTRLAGNVVNEDVLGGMEFATNFSDAQCVLVMGHTKCGAVKGAVADVEYGNLTALVKKIKPAVEQAKSSDTEGLEPGSDAFTDLVGKINVEKAVEYIRENSPELRKKEESGEIVICGAMYDISNGKVTFFDN